MGIRWILTSLLLTSIGFFNVFCEDETVSTLRDASIVLTCPIDIKACGELHSVKWFKGIDRIAVVSGDGTIKNIESEYNSRMTIEHNPQGPSTQLKLKSVKVSDEEIYMCESTYLEPLETCETSGSYSILLKVNVPPSLIQIVDESFNPIKNSSSLGPLREGQSFTVTCEVKGTRPAPIVGWYRAGARIPDSVTTDEANGLFSVKSVLSLTLKRQELGALFECRVESPALETIVRNQIHLDLQVRPNKVEITGIKHHAVQGSNLLLNCNVFGARPAANVTWYNNSMALVPDADMEKRTLTTRTELKEDGTFQTISQMIFTASRFENGINIRCEADNVVMRDGSDKPLQDSLILEVLYPPVVTVKPDNFTVKEGESFLLICEYEANPASLKQAKWLKNGKVIDTSASRYEGAKSDQQNLSVINATRNDIGSYTCQLFNEIGAGLSENDVDVDVHYYPIVELTMDPEVPIIEDMESNVTLYCNVLEGNPSTLLKVRWFLDRQVLKELPECNDDKNKNNDDDDDDDADADDDDDDDDDNDHDDSLCGVNPNILLLENVGREFLGNYSCEGLNAAGWGPRSIENDLVIYYEPGNATLVHDPLIASKKDSITFTCSVDDAGNPAATRFRWLRGGRPIMDVVTPIWTVDPVGLDSRTNISCYAYNDGGDGIAATSNLEVRAGPTFIKKLPPYTGALYSTPNISLYCRVECSPECNIFWYKDGMPIEENDERYYVQSLYRASEPSVGDFESIESNLYFNISAWPDSKLDIYKDNANYSCISSENVAGKGVKSDTYFGVEYPPENTTVSNLEINVIEGSIPQRVWCSAKAYPEPSFEWRHNDESLSNESTLILERIMKLSDHGQYQCVSRNRHGNHSATLLMNVLYKPNCTIEQYSNNDEDLLICRAYGNPSNSVFEWSLKSDNETIDEEIRTSQDGGLPASFLVLNNDFTTARTYRCVANNSVGVGNYCEIEVEGHIAWWQRFDRMTIIIFIAAIAAILLAVIIICICIICICRRKRRRQNKSQDKSSAAGDPLTDPGEYENLPFHGMQSAPNKPLSAADLADDLEYADVDFRSYGPINYKAASIYALVKKNKNGNLKEIGK